MIDVTSERRNISVFLGASDPKNMRMEQAVRELGTWIGSRGHRLVYGGSKSGLMGMLAESTSAAGGEVIGVEPNFFIEREPQFENLTELVATEDLTERKLIMIERGDAFIAFPGGTGTLEEIAEVISRITLDLLDAPCILYNLDGFFEGLRTQLTVMADNGLYNPDKLALITFADSIGEIESVLEASGIRRGPRGPRSEPILYRRNVRSRRCGGTRARSWTCGGCTPNPSP